MATSIKGLIHTLNHLTIGEIGTLRYRVTEVRTAVKSLGLDEIAEILDEALDHLERGDLKAFRKKIAHGVSRLGHVRDPAAAGSPPAGRSGVRG